MKKQENNTNTTNIRRELEAKERQLQRDYEILENQKKQNNYMMSRADGYDFIMREYCKEDLQICQDQIDKTTKEIEKLKELIEKQKTTTSIEVFPYRRS